MRTFSVTLLIVALVFVAPGVGATDLDGDGYSAPEDCDDSDGSVHPGAIEVADDAVDQDCDGFELCYVDADDDGYRPDSVSTVFSSDLTCFGSGEATATDPTGDCDDAISSVYPGADEVCDGLDNDCDGLVDGGDLDEDGVAAACGDLCFGDDASGDADLDGVCADRDCDDDDTAIGLCIFIDGFESSGTSEWSHTVPAA